MNFEASAGILILFFLWVIFATIWWSKKMKRLKAQIEEMKNNKKIN